MSCIYEDVRCPNCGRLHRKEQRQDLVFCDKLKCGIYFDKFGNKYTKYEAESMQEKGYSLSSMPVSDFINRIKNKE